MNPVHARRCGIELAKYLPHLTVVGEADSVKCGTVACWSKPHKACLDIEMPLGSGFDIWMRHGTSNSKSSLSPHSANMRSKPSTFGSGLPDEAGAHSGAEEAVERYAHQHHGNSFSRNRVSFP